MSRVLLRLVLLAGFGSATATARVSAQPAPTPVDKKQVAGQYTDAGRAPPPRSATTTPRSPSTRRRISSCRTRR